jgi:pilus assembly protein Flp/PilA
LKTACYKRTSINQTGELEMKKFMNMLKDESGATAIEYGLIAGLISVVIIIAVTSVGSELKRVFTDITAELGKAKSGA